MELKVINKSNYPLPKYKYVGDSGMDVCANIDEKIELGPLDRALISTGLFIEIPEGYEIQVRPRSGLAIKRGLTVLNSPGTVDSNYKDEIKVIIVNLSNEKQIIEPGERIAQFVLAKVENATLVESDKISMENNRGGGFGHSGQF